MFDQIDMTKLIFGRLSWDAIPFHEPILLATFVMVGLGGITLLGALTYFRVWGVLWRNWFTSIDHKRILVSTNEYARLLDERELEPTKVTELVSSQGRNVLIGALAALASYALFHLVTVFPLSWITLYSPRSLSNFLYIQVGGAALMALAVVASGVIADKFGRRNTLGTLALMIAVLSGFVPTLLDGGERGQNIFILLGFVLLGLSYGQAAGAVTANFAAKYRYTGAALTSDLAWLVGAGFAPLVALGLSSHFGLEYVSLYLLSGAACSLAALSLNRALEIRD